MSSVFGALMCIGLACAPSVNGAKTSNNGIVDETFGAFAKRHGRSYKPDSAEYAMRLSLFEKRQNEVLEHNGKSGQSYKVILNHFSDLTNQERKMYLGLRPTVKKAPTPASMLESGSTRSNTDPNSTDWSTTDNTLGQALTSATSIPDQGSCGSCWAVATVGMMEAHYEIHHQQVKRFSVQDLVNCVPNPESCGGAGGCQGATVELALNYTKMRGLDYDDINPTSYTAQDAACTKPGAEDMQATPKMGSSVLNPTTNDASNRGILAGVVTGYTTLPANSAQDLQTAMYNYGPIALSVAAGDWFSYSNGIFDGCAKDPATIPAETNSNKGMVIDHAVLGYGYGVDSGVGYWKIRNSWGQLWGENGFIRLARTFGDDTTHEDNYCAIDYKPETGTGCLYTNGTAKELHITVCGMCGVLWDSVYPHMSTQAVVLEEKQTIVVDSDAVVRKAPDTDAF